MFEVVKRDGEVTEFNLNKISAAIAKAFDATKKFRERYADKGIFENRLYDGIDELLRKLHDEGKRLCVATSKPIVHTEKILEYFDIRKYFDIVVGSDLEGKFCNKSDIISEVLKKCGNDRENSVMVGDRKYDILGAKENEIKSVAVLYGYGNMEEFVLAGADFIAESVEKISDFVL